MKVLFIGVTIFILYLMRLKAPICNTYMREKEDDFPHIYLIPVSLVLTLLIHSEWDWWELIWCFSLWLESLAIFPQVNILAKQQGIESFTSHYIASLGAYRFFYLLNWIYRYKTEGFLSWVSILSGTLQVLLYADFFYLYLKNIKKQFTSELPVSAMTPKPNDSKN